MLLVLLLQPVGYAVGETPSEYQIKAGFLYNFAKFTDWGTSVGGLRDSNFFLCIIGKDPFGPALGAIEGKVVYGQRLKVKVSVPLDELRGCHMLYVSDSEERHLPSILKALKNLPVLTVSDIEGFVDAGGMVGLVLADNRILFDINLSAVNAANLKISSQLLRLARSVSGGKDRS